MNRNLKKTDFPGLYQASDTASIKAQSKYTKLIAFDLVFMIISATLAIYNYNQTESKLFVYVVSGLFLLFSLVLTIIMRTMKFEDTWYQGRALAESCKTLTWRFITCSESFEQDMNEEDAKQLFVNRIRELSKDFFDLNSVLNAKTATLPIITTKMMEIRTLNMLERKQFYIENRIEDQKKWYSNKAEFNETRYNLWFIIIIVSQVLAIISVVVLISYPESDWNLVGLFTTVSSSALSWLQLKQHQELKQAYTTATQELNFISASAGRINSETALSEFVLDSENAISREHTLWLAQKRT